MDSGTKNIAAALTSALMWATAFVAPAAVRPASELLLVTGRYSLFGLCGFWVLFRARTRIRSMPRRRILFGVYLGFVGYFIFYICVAYSARLGSGFITAAVVGATPIAIAVAGNVAEKRMEWRQLVAPIVLILFGILFLTVSDFVGDYLGGGTTERGVFGVLLAIVSMLSWSYFVVRNAQSQRTWEVRPDPTIWSGLVAAGAGSASLVLLPYALVTTPAETFTGYPLAKLVLWCVFLGVIASWWGTCIWVKAAQGIPVPLVGPLLATETIFGAILSLPVEGRMPTWTEVVGALAILTGIAVYLLFDIRNARLLTSPACLPDTPGVAVATETPTPSRH